MRIFTQILIAYILYVFFFKQTIISDYLPCPWSRLTAIIILSHNVNHPDLDPERYFDYYSELHLHIYVKPCFSYNVYDEFHKDILINHKIGGNCVQSSSRLDFTFKFISTSIIISGPRRL